jgi:hypothetical protein
MNETEYVNKEVECRKCGHVGYPKEVIYKNGNYMAYCANCGGFTQKNLPKKDKYATKDQRSELWSKTLGRCGYCGISINPDENCGANYDHVMPKSRGGSNESENLMLTCKSCNSQKKDKTPSEYRTYLKSYFGTETHVFFFEIMAYSCYGRRLLKKYKIDIAK